MPSPRLTHGWTRLKTIGDVEPVLILVNKETGKFGTSLDNGENIRDWESLPEAEAFVKEINEAGAVDAVVAETNWNDGVLKLIPLRLKRVGKNWVRMDGTRLRYDSKPLIPDAEASLAIERFRQRHEEAKALMVQLRSEAWEVVKQMTPLE